MIDQYAKLIVVALLALSVVLNFISWGYRKFANSLLYLESFWAIFDAALMAREYAAFPIVLNATRFIAIAVFFGIDFRPTIITTTFFAIQTHLVVQVIANEEIRNVIELIVTVLIVLSTISIFWAYLL